MQPHIPSMFLMLIALSTTLALVVGIAGWSDRRNGVAHWAAGMGCAALSIALWTLRGRVPDVWTVIVANTSMGCALSLSAVAICRFQQRKPPWLWLLLPVLALPLLHALWLDNQPVRFLINGSVLSMQAGVTAVLLWQRRLQTRGVGPYLMVAGYLLLVLVLLGQSSAVLLQPDQMQSIFQPNAVQASVFLATAVHMVLVNMGLLIMLRERLEEQVRSLSMHDELTGLLNRRALLQTLQQQLAQGQRGQHAVSVLMVDIDFFKRVNDTWGHPSGDRVLRQLASTIGQRLRSQDLCGRMGGEEFLVILPDTQAHGALELAQCLRASVEQMRFESVGGHAIALTISVGVATSVEPKRVSMDTLIGLADAALYRAKQLGRNRVEVAESSPTTSQEVGLMVSSGPAATA